MEKFCYHEKVNECLSPTIKILDKYVGLKKMSIMAVFLKVSNGMMYTMAAKRPYPYSMGNLSVLFIHNLYVFFKWQTILFLL